MKWPVGVWQYPKNPGPQTDRVLRARTPAIERPRILRVGSYPMDLTRTDVLPEPHGNSSWKSTIWAPQGFTDVHTIMIPNWIPRQERFDRLTGSLHHDSQGVDSKQTNPITCTLLRIMKHVSEYHNILLIKNMGHVDSEKMDSASTIIFSPTTSCISDINSRIVRDFFWRELE